MHYFFPTSHTNFFAFSDSCWRVRSMRATSSEPADGADVRKPPSAPAAGAGVDDEAGASIFLLISSNVFSKSPYFLL